MILITKTVEETKALGAFLGQVLDTKATISLEGELGAGKTHFVKGLAEGMGILEEVTSPTFALVQEYLQEDSEKHGSFPLKYISSHLIVSSNIGSDFCLHSPFTEALKYF